jgi:hypothetical protein
MADVAGGEPRGHATHRRFSLAMLERFDRFLPVAASSQPASAWRSR